MNVIAAAECLNQQRVLRKMRQQPKLDLRIVGGEQQMPRRGSKGSANLAPKLGAYRNILQVRICGGEPSGCSAGLVEGSVQPSSCAVQQRRKRVHISGFQLGKLAVFQHQLRGLVVGRKRFKNVHGSRDRLALAVLHRLRQIQLVKQDIAKLLRRIDIELRAAAVIYLFGLELNLALQSL